MKKIISLLFLFAFILSDAQNGKYNGWLPKGNSWGNNNSYIGTNDSRSLCFYANGAEGAKLDSLRRFYIKQSSTNIWSFQGLVSGTTTPAFYIGVTTPTVTNYCIIGDGINNVFNAPTTLFLRTNNVSILEANTTPTVSAELIDFDAINIPTVAANASILHLRIVGNKIGFNSGTTPIQRKMLISGDTYTSNGSAILTDAPTLDILAPTISTGVTTTNPPWGIRATGNQNFTGAVIIGGALTTAPSKTLDVVGNANISSSLTTNGLANTTTITSTGAITTPSVFGSSAVGGNLFLGSTSDPTKGIINVGVSTSTTSIPGTFSLQAVNLTAGNTGTLAVVSDNIFSFQFGWSVQNPADATTYFLSSANLFNGNVAGNGRIALPVACTFIGYSFNNINLTLNGTNEASTLNIRKNATTTTALNTAITFSATSFVSDFTKNITFAAGDDFVPSLVTATWPVTNPAGSCMVVVFYFKRQ